MIKRIPWQFIRFGIVGTGGYLVDIGVLTALIHSGMDDYNGQIVAFLVAASFTWLVNRLWTFAEHRSTTAKAKEGLRYFIATAIGMCINYAVYALLITLGGLWHAYPQLAAAAGSIAGLAFNFPASKYFVFRPAVSASPEGPASSPDP